MKRTALFFLGLLTPLSTTAQESDSLKVEENIVLPAESETYEDPFGVTEDSDNAAEALVTEADSAEQLTPVQEVFTSGDTVFVREVVYDTVFMSTPAESVAIQAENVDIHSENKPRKRSEIKTLSGSMGHSGGFGAISFRSSKFRDETIVMAGLRGGWIINRSLAIGLEGHGIIPTAKFQGLSQFDAVLIGGYGGLFLEPIFFSNNVVHVTFPVSAGGGWLGYHEDFDEGRFDGPDLIEGDEFWYIEPGANVELNLARNFRIALGVSKRFTQDLQLIDTSSKDFNKINYYLTLKIGSF